VGGILMMTREKLVDDFPALDSFDPGTRYAYSGDGIILLQFVLERGLGLDVRAEMQRRVFDHTKVRELRETAAWAGGMVWTSAEGHGAKTGIMKA